MSSRPSLRYAVLAAAVVALLAVVAWFTRPTSEGPGQHPALHVAGAEFERTRDLADRRGELTYWTVISAHWDG